MGRTGQDRPGMVGSRGPGRDDDALTKIPSIGRGRGGGGVVEWKRRWQAPLHAYISSYLVVIMARAEGTLEGEGATTSPAIHPFVRPPTGDDIRDPLSNAEPCPTPPPFSWSRHLHQYVKAQRAMTSVGQLCLRCLETVELHLAVAWRGVPTHASKLAGPSSIVGLPPAAPCCRSNKRHAHLILHPCAWFSLVGFSFSITHALIRTHTHSYAHHAHHTPATSLSSTYTGRRAHPSPHCLIIHALQCRHPHRALCDFPPSWPYFLALACL